MVIDVEPSASTAPPTPHSALAAVEGVKVRSEDRLGVASMGGSTSTAPTASTACPWWTATTSPLPKTFGKYSYMPDGKEWWLSSTSAWTREHNDLDRGRGGQLRGRRRGWVGITAAMRRCLGAFQTVRVLTTPNATCGEVQPAGFPLAPRAEDGRSVSLGTTGDADVAAPSGYEAGLPPVLREAPRRWRRASAVDGGLARSKALGLVLCRACPPAPTMTTRRKQEDPEERSPVREAPAPAPETFRS